jgi:hypothetical protein
MRTKRGVSSSAVRAFDLARQRGEKGADALDQLMAAVGGQAPRQRRQLEHQRPGAFAEALHRRDDEPFDGEAAVEERRVVGRRLAAFAAQQCVGDCRRRLDQEPEVLRHLAGIGLVLATRQRLVVAAIDADRAQQRVSAVGGQPRSRQLRFAVLAAVDDALPAGKAPRRGAEPDRRRQPAPEPQQVVADGSRLDRAARCPRPEQRVVVFAGHGRRLRGPVRSGARALNRCVRGSAR